MTIIFKIKGQPPRGTAQGKKYARTVNGVKVYPSAGAKAARDYYDVALMAHRPKETIEGPVRLDVLFEFSTPRKKDVGTWKTTKPDTDNMIKGLKDAMTDAGFWKDDAQVVDEHVRKKWTTREKAGVTIIIDAIKNKEEATQ